MKFKHRSPRPLFGASVVLLLALAIPVVLALPGTATSGTSQRPVYQPPQSYYLALGDSITYGFQPDKAKPGARPSGFRHRLRRRLRRASAEARSEDPGRQLRMSR